MVARYTQQQVAQLQFPVLSPVNAEPDVFPVALDRPVCVVGGRSRVHLPLQAIEVSKAQALLISQADGVYIRDLASRNRTYVNHEPVREARLKTGDVVQFGTVAFQCQSGFDRFSLDDSVEAAELWLEPDGLSSRRLMPIARRTFLIGSRGACDLQLKSDKISLSHAVIFVREGVRYIRDLDSLTGTFVNNQRIREVELRDGDSIRIHTTTVQYHAAHAFDQADTQSFDATTLAEAADTESPEYIAGIEQGVFMADDSLGFAKV